LPALAALALLLARPVAAFEHTQFQPVILPSEDPAGPFRVPATLNIPSGWQPGHAAAVLLFDPPSEPALRDSLLVALLDSGAAVLELDANTARGFSADALRNPPPPTAEGLARDLAGALAFLREDAEAGVVVAIGHGLGGEAALLVAEPARLTGLLGENGPRYAAVASVGPAAPAFRAGPAPDPGEQWPARVPMLCEVLAYALGATPTPLGPPRDGPGRMAEAAGACEAALMPGALAATPRGSATARR
jgi:hypothetical protein